MLLDCELKVMLLLQWRNSVEIKIDFSKIFEKIANCGLILIFLTSILFVTFKYSWIFFNFKA